MLLELSVGGSLQLLREVQVPLRLLNSASGPEIVELGVLNGPLPPQNPLEKVGGEAPYLFQWTFAVGRGRLDPKNRRFPVRKHD